MKILTFFLLFITFVAGLPVASLIAGDVLGSDPLVPRPISERPVEGWPVEGRPIQFSPTIPRSLETRQTVPNAYIIEFKHDYTHEMFYKWTKDQNIQYDIRVLYEHKLFMGVSVQFKNSGDAEKVRKWEGTLNFWPVQVFTIPPCDVAC